MGKLEHDVGAGLARALGRRVGRAVAGDDDLQALARVVERQCVGDLGRDHRLLGVGGDHERDARPSVRLSDLGPPARMPAQPRQRGQQHSVAGLRVDEQARAEPEGDLHRR